MLLLKTHLSCNAALLLTNLLLRDFVYMPCFHKCTQFRLCLLYVVGQNILLDQELSVKKLALTYHRNVSQNMVELQFILTCFSFCLAVFFFLTFIHVKIFSQNLITGKKQLNAIHIYQLRYYIDKKHTYHTVNICVSQTSSHTLDLFVRSHVCVCLCVRDRGGIERARGRGKERERERLVLTMQLRGTGTHSPPALAFKCYDDGMHYCACLYMKFLYK